MFCDCCLVGKVEKSYGVYHKGFLVVIYSLICLIILPEESQIPCTG